MDLCHYIEWARDFLMELGFVQKEPARIYTDAQSLIQVTNNPVLHARTRHFRLRLDYLRQLVQRQVVIFHYVPTNENVADTLTKALPLESFSRHRRGLVGRWY